MSVPYPFPYQSSKRALAPILLGYLPSDTERLIELFAGTGALSLAAAAQKRAKTFALNDLNAPLIALWDQILHKPRDLAEQYRQLWNMQQGREKEFYAEIRTAFNKTHQADHFLYLLARCVKSSVRYNDQGEFNQSADNRRKGAQPATMTRQIIAVAALLNGRTMLSACDYQDMLQHIGPRDVVYLDPPYQGVSKTRDARYLSGVDFDQLAHTLNRLNIQNVSYLVSYDGRTGTKTFGKPLPDMLRLTRIELHAGRSTQATLLGQDKRTVESLYLSESLVNRLETCAPLQSVQTRFA